MSAVYNLEPQPTAKVLLETTAGEILLEVFAKQTPIASRNFIQLCLEGYYDGTIFHRLVPGFIIQGGDPSGTGDGGEAIYDGGVFEDEFHSRLKFNRRGLLGMANSGQKNDNGSQFFLTLGKTEELTNKNTMFGRVAGDTIYNLMKMGEAELTEGEKSERPLYPTKVLKTEVLLNPFEDIVPRKLKQVEFSTSEKGLKARKAKKKGGKALLSFGDEDGDASQDGPVIKKARFNPKLVTGESTSREQPLRKKDNASTFQENPVRRALSTQLPASPEAPRPELQLPIRNEETPSWNSDSSSTSGQEKKESSQLYRTNAQIAELKSSMRRTTATAAIRIESRPKSALEEMVPATARRGRKRKHMNTQQSDGDTRALDMLNAFRAKLDQAPPEDAEENREQRSLMKPTPEQDMKTNGKGDESQLCDLHFIANCQSCASWDEQNSKKLEDDSDDDAGWMNHSLIFSKDALGKDLNWKKKNEEELVVIDPREKAKDIKAEQKAKKAARLPSHRVRDAGRLEKSSGDNHKK